MPLGMDPNPQISAISQTISQIVDAQGTAKNFLQQSIIKAWMQPSLRRNYRFSPLSRVGWSASTPPSRRLLCRSLSTCTAFCFFIGDSFRQDSTWKICFRHIKWSFHENKMTQIWTPDFYKEENPNRQISMLSSSKYSKNIERLRWWVPIKFLSTVWYLLISWIRGIPNTYHNDFSMIFLGEFPLFSLV